MKYDAEVSAATAHWSRALGVVIDPRLVHAVIERESRHGKYVQTNEGGGRWSYGPMMVLDATARAFGVVSPESLKAPALGIYYGVRALGEELKRFHGDTWRAVSAYNTGASRANRNAAGRFPNQAYVDAVRGFWNQYGGAVAGSGVAALVAVAGILVLLRARRRRAA